MRGDAPQDVLRTEIMSCSARPATKAMGRRDAPVAPRTARRLCAISGPTATRPIAMWRRDPRPARVTPMAIWRRDVPRPCTAHRLSAISGPVVEDR